MKWSWTALAIASVAILAMAGCNDYGNTFQNNTGAFVSFLSPAQIAAGNPDFTLTLTGAGFVAKTKVQWNGKPLVTTVPTDSTGAVVGNSITAAVPAAMVANPGVVTVITVNPASGAGNNGLSNPVAFVINPAPNPLPALTSIAPGGLVNGSPQSTLTLTGTNFLPPTDPSGGSQVNWSANGTLTKLAMASSSTSGQITATIPQALLATAGQASVTVFNPPSPPPAGCTTSCNGGGGGGSSPPQTFTICATGQTPCPPAASAVRGAANAGALVAEETPAVSMDGRFVAYAAAQNDHGQVFLRDTCEGAASGCQSHAILVSVAPDGSAANDESHSPSMSSDGRYVAFSSAATNLVDNAPRGRQIYLRDTCFGAGESCKPATHLISLDPNGALVGTESILPSVSSSGRFVAFLAITPGHSSNQNSDPDKASSTATNSGYRQVFIRDTCLGASNCTPKTTRISLQPGDGAGTGAKSAGPALGGNAKHVAVAGGNTATLFTRSVAVDDRVFLAMANERR
ncbi:MAG TPA: hypothetical protein VH110_07765 [Candidatus Acidoferrum sp.]|jgi:hypothetical protein|nr:hypothetical protein [Candidatus Acidoferrum sp.]